MLFKTIVALCLVVTALQIADAKSLGKCLGTFDLNDQAIVVSKENMRTAALAKDRGKVVRVAVLVDKNFSVSQLADAGWRLISRIGDVVTLEGRERSVPYLTAIDGILSVDKRVNIRPCMDSVRNETHINEVHGTVTNSLATHYTGKGVIFGIMDIEFDTHEPAFLDSLGKTRFIAIWDQAKTYSRANRFGYGMIKMGQELNQDSLFGSDSTEYHGTHMASLGAGSDRKTPYWGAAPDAKIVAVKYGNSISNLINGLQWIDSLADSLHMPCVINMSIGIQEGPHDGTSLMDRCIDSLVKAGHIIVGAAGNDGNTKVHISFPLGARGSRGTWIEPVDNSQYSYIDMWGDSGKVFFDTIYVLDVSNSSFKKSGVSFSTINNITYNPGILLWPNTKTGPDTLLFYITIDSLASINSKPHMNMMTYSSNPNLRIGHKVYSVTAQTIHAWNFAKANLLGLGITGFYDGDSISSIDEVGGTSKRLITAGGYDSKVTCLRWDKSVFGAGDTNLYHYLEYTSLGPTIDGRVKPDISAPGREVTGAVTRWVVDNAKLVAVWPDTTTKYGRYAFLGGTSVSSPIVAGIIALMLEANPQLTPENAKQLLQQTAIRDTFTGKILPDNRWGAGKVNALGAMNALLTPTSLQRTEKYLAVSPAPKIKLYGANRLRIFWPADAADNAGTVELYDLAGKRLFASTVKGDRFVTLPQHLGAGCMIVRVVWKQGVVTQQIIAGM